MSQTGNNYSTSSPSFDTQDGDRNTPKDPPISLTDDEHVLSPPDTVSTLSSEDSQELKEPEDKEPVAKNEPEVREESEVKGEQELIVEDEHISRSPADPQSEQQQYNTEQVPPEGKPKELTEATGSGGEEEKVMHDVDLKGYDFTDTEEVSTMVLSTAYRRQ